MLVLPNTHAFINYEDVFVEKVSNISGEDISFFVMGEELFILPTFSYAPLFSQLIRLITSYFFRVLTLINSTHMLLNIVS